MESINPNCFIVTVSRSGKQISFEFPMTITPANLCKAIHGGLADIQAAVDRENGKKPPAIQLAGVEHLKKVPVDSE